MKYSFLSGFIIIFGIFGCSPQIDSGEKFKLLSAERTGIHFNNSLEINDSFNVLDFDYIYNGGGVGVADFNGDGLQDIFFTGNMVTSRLYLNKGEFKFEDITDFANVKTDTWAEGITMVDINQDGLMDIYISVSNKDNAFPNPNLLFVHQGLNPEGIPVFEEMAFQYGIADRGYNTQSAFFDYDGDGDLDLYILSNALETFQRNLSRPKELTGKGKSNDKLYQNNGGGTFSNVTAAAGIVIEGYGLGLSITDINLDGWPDIYVANDFISNDILYINNQDGTFTNKIAEMLNHQSFNAMGVDVADFNNDNLPDIIVVDMFPPDNFRQKTMFAPTENYDLYQANLGRGYEAQYVRNTLQLNRGNGKFSEIGFLSGIAQTDWSWAPLFADLDNDGFKDLFISNGYGKDVTDMDYINFSQNLGPFTTPDERRNKLLEGMGKLEVVNLPNYLFKNNQDLTFSDKSTAWGITHSFISNGVVYADFDNDGDLDLVGNNLNETAFVYQNQSREKEPENTNFLKFSLNGSTKNPDGLGAKIKIKYKTGALTQMQYHEHFPSRGYKSFVEPVAHFGLKEIMEVEEIEVIWPDRKFQIIQKIIANQTITLNHSDAVERVEMIETISAPDFVEAGHALGIDFLHKTIPYKDFNRQRLLPHKHSENGPGIAVGDINGDGLEDFFVGGSNGSSGIFFIQGKDGKFQKKTFGENYPYDDMGCLLFDADGDGDVDLYVVNGGSRFAEGSPEYQDRLYLNDGKGEFTIGKDLLPVMNFSGSNVAAADYDGDGDLDLFVGGRVRPGQYPLPPKSVILNNEGGKFSDTGNALFQSLDALGMVTAGLWTDFDQDGMVDLIVVGEWMPIKFLKQNRSASGVISFEDLSKDYAPKHSTGWWNSIISMSFDSDGIPKYVLGNLGMNSRWNTNQNKPLVMVAKDFDGNQSVDPILFQYLKDGYFAVPGRDMLLSQVPSWKNRFLTFSQYAKTKMEDFFLDGAMENALKLELNYFQSAILQKSKGLSFHLTPLPIEAQFSPTYGMVLTDNGGKESLLISGNFYGNETITGSYDASKGVQIDFQKGIANYVQIKKSGFEVSGQGRSLAIIRGNQGNELVLAAQYGDSLKVFQNQKPQPYKNVVKLEPLDYLVKITLRDGSVSSREFYYGEGFLSQSSRILPVLDSYQKVEIKDFKGNSRTVWED